MFESARLKIKRADQHIADLEREFQAFVDRKPHRFGVKQDLQTGQPVIQIRMVEAVPESFGVIIGDAIHNLRCSLDHFTWEIVGWAKGNQHNYLHFPVRDNREEHEKACRKIEVKIPWVNDLLIGYEAFPSGNGEAFYILNKLDVADKHRVVTPVARATTHPTFQIFDAKGNARVRFSRNLFIGVHGVMSIAGVPPGGHVELEDDSTCSPAIFFRDPDKEVISYLRWLSGCAESIVKFAEDEMAAQAAAAAKA